MSYSSRRTLASQQAELQAAIAYSFSTIKGKAIKSIGQQQYIGRQRKIKQSLTRKRVGNSPSHNIRRVTADVGECKTHSRHSNFWVGLYGDVWIITREFVAQWVEELMRVNLNKFSFYQKGLRAITIIKQAF
jgi:hypothetical protein